MFPLKEVYTAHSVDEALSLYAAHPQARYMAGGSDLLIDLRNGKMNDAEIISLFQIDALKGIRLKENGTLVIGPLSCFTDINRSPIIKKTASVLGEAAGMVGGPQIRNIGTIGGNICNGVPSADTASTLLAYDAVLELTGPNGVRHVCAADFPIGLKKTLLMPGEILTEIRIPKESYADHYGKYIKFSTRKAMDIATIGCSANLSLTDDKKSLRDLRLAFGVVGPVPMRLYETEKTWAGAAIDEKLPEMIGSSVQKEIHPRSSWRASSEFRLILAAELSARAIRSGIIQAGGVC